uniref:Uncharacterized protein n=1 Tax=Leersia perrieri TaxID=77586 RepID=A0A0D9X8M6_9ORYZ
MATAVCVSDVPLPPPICRRPASTCRATSSLSPPASGKSPRSPPTISEDEFNEMFFAEHGCDPTQMFFTKEEVQMLMRQYEAEKAYLLSHGEGKQETAPPPASKKRKAPQTTADNAEVQTPPPKSSSNKKMKAAAAAPPRSLWPTHSDVAERILYRRFETPELSKGVTILSCQCREELPRGCCALHQEAPFRAWMSEQGNVPAEGGGGGGWARVPKLSEHCGRCLFQYYKRWRGQVWMPTRFFLESVAQPPKTT